MVSYGYTHLFFRCRSCPDPVAPRVAEAVRRCFFFGAAAVPAASPKTLREFCKPEEREADGASRRLAAAEMAATRAVSACVEWWPSGADVEDCGHEAFCDRRRPLSGVLTVHVRSVRTVRFS
jgi:hypothetical protein